MNRGLIEKISKCYKSSNHSPHPVAGYSAFNRMPLPLLHIQSLYRPGSNLSCSWILHLLPFTCLYSNYMIHCVLPVAINYPTPLPLFMPWSSPSLCLPSCPGLAFWTSVQTLGVSCSTFFHTGTCITIICRLVFLLCKVEVHQNMSLDYLVFKYNVCLLLSLTY